MNSGTHDIILPPEFSGAGQFILFTRYGDPRDLGWENKWITNWDVQENHPWFPEKQLLIHKHFRPMLDSALSILEESGLHEEITSCSCCYEIRPVRGGGAVLSVHSWGAAIDLNIDENPIGSAGNWSGDFIEIMKSSHIYCGQTWEGRKEPMHFAMVNG
jgi:hypothetical protein